MSATSACGNCLHRETTVTRDMPDITVCLHTRRVVELNDACVGHQPGVVAVPPHALLPPLIQIGPTDC